jgi:capsular polysaccharide transport system permease protein
MSELKFDRDSVGPQPGRSLRDRRSEEAFYSTAKSAAPAFDETLEVPPLPAAAAEQPRALLISFLLCVVLPTLIVAVYYFFVASGQYETQFRFTVIQGSPAVPGNPAPGTTQSGASASASSMVQALTGMGGQGTSIASAQNYVVVDYLQSRQAIADLEKRLNLSALYSRSDIDFMSRFNPRKSDEYLADYWKKMVAASYDPMTGLATVTVRAFKPQDAKAIADGLVISSEGLVNNIINKPNLDAVRAAELQVVTSQQRVKDVRGRLAAFRNSAGVIDPTQSAVPVNTQLVESLRPNVIQLQSQLSAMKDQGLGSSPAAGVVAARLAAARQQLAGVRGEVGGGRQSLTGVVGRYEKVNFDVQFEQNLLDSALQTLAQTRAYALQQKMYILPYEQPNLPQASLYPQRLQSTVLAAFLLFGVWLIGSLVVKAIQQHVD